MKTMKKISALVMSSVLALSFCTSAFAADQGVTATSATTIDIVTKNYNVIGNENSVYPTEELNFAVTPGTGNPDSEPLVTVDKLTVSGTSNKLTINIPSYDEVGTYHYTISEVAGNTQAVTYTENEIELSVQVVYNDDHTALVATPGITNTGSTESSVKVDTLTNTYVLGSLDVKKEVAGNLADRDKYFKITVEFTAEKNVESDITISGGSNTNNPTTISENDWENNKVSVDIYLKHDETVHFADIPDGVTYTVVEDSAHLTGDANGDEGYTATYAGTDNAANGEGSIISTSETVTDEETGKATTTITADNDKVVITNTKGAVVDTGINLDNMPYIMVLALVALGFVGFVSKKRSMEF